MVGLPLVGWPHCFQQDTVFHAIMCIMVKVLAQLDWATMCEAKGERPTEGPPVELMRKVDVETWLGKEAGAMVHYAFPPPDYTAGPQILWERSTIEQWWRVRGTRAPNKRPRKVKSRE